MAREAIPTETYCQSVLDEALHYTKGDSWTPNGVRRVYISPDGVVVEPFLGGLRGISKRHFSAKSFFDCTNSAKYKPMLSMLAGSGDSRVYSHIEEILVFPMSKAGNLVLNPKEADYKNLAINAQMSKEGLMKRYVRLRNVIVMNVDLQTFWTWYTNPQGGINYNKLDKFLGESDWIRTRASSIDSFHGSDWYRHTAFRPQYYPVGDADNGSLRRTLTELKNTLDSRKTTDKIAKVKNEHLSELVNACVKNVKLVLPFAFCWATLSLLVTTDNSSIPQKKSVSVDNTVFSNFTALREKAVVAGRVFESKTGCNLAELISLLDSSDLPTINSWYKLISPTVGGASDKPKLELSESVLSSARDNLIIQAKTLWVLLCELFNTTYDNSSVHPYDVVTDYIVSGGGRLHAVNAPVEAKLGINTGAKECAENSAAVTMTNMLIHYYFSEDFIKFAKLGKEYLKSYGKVNK